MNKDEALKMAIEAMEMWDKKHIIEMKVGERWIDLSYAINACKEALEQPLTRDWKDTIDERIARDSEFKEALEQPAQEPVAYTDEYKHFLEWDIESLCDKAVCKEHEAIPLYTHPHQWQGLNVSDIKEIVNKLYTKEIMFDLKSIEFARAIEQALKDRNHG